MRRALATVALGLVGAASACNALSGVSDLEVGECGAECADAALPPGPDAAPGDAAPPPPADSGVDAPADVATGPSFCTGITLYLPLDGTLTSVEGVSPTSTPTLSYTTGKFGTALDLTSTSPSLYYPVGGLEAGTPAYTLAHGSAMVWLKASWTVPGPQSRVFIKPKSGETSGATSAGPYLETAGTTGLVAAVDVDGGGAAVLTPGVTSGWTSGAWNLLVMTWSQGTPSMSFSLNGAAPVTVGTAWTPSEAPPNLLRVSSGASPPNAIFDEVALWDRELSSTEIAALHASTQSLGSACGL